MLAQPSETRFILSRQFSLCSMYIVRPQTKVPAGFSRTQVGKKQPEHCPTAIERWALLCNKDGNLRLNEALDDDLLVDQTGGRTGMVRLNKTYA